MKKSFSFVLCILLALQCCMLSVYAENETIDIRFTDCEYYTGTAISKEGNISLNTNSDTAVYSFNIDKEGIYTYAVWAIGNGEVSVTIDEQVKTFSTTDTPDVFVTLSERVTLTAGEHTLKISHVSGYMTFVAAAGLRFTYLDVLDTDDVSVKYINYITKGSDSVIMETHLSVNTDFDFTTYSFYISKTGMYDISSEMMPCSEGCKAAFEIDGRRYEIVPENTELETIKKENLNESVYLENGIHNLKMLHGAGSYMMIEAMNFTFKADNNSDIIVKYADYTETGAAEAFKDPYINVTNDNAWFTYNFTIEKSGLYEITTKMQPLSNECWAIFQIDDLEYKLEPKKIYINKAKMEKITELIYLTHGNHIVKVLHGYGSYNLLTNFKLSYIEPFSGIKKEAEDYMSGGEGAAYHDANAGCDDESQYTYTTDDVEIGAGASGKIVASEDGEWLKYQVNLLYEGDYNFNICYASENENTKISIAADGKKVSEKLMESTAGNYRIAEIGKLNLKKGNHIIKISVEGGAINLDYFRLEYSVRINNLLTKINSATSYESAYEIVSQYSDLFLEQFYVADSMFYPQIIARHLIDKNFQSFTDLYNAFNDAAEAENNNKSVVLKYGTREITEYRKGTLNVDINLKLKENELFTYAVYENGKLKFIYGNPQTDVSNTSFSITDLGYNSKNEYTTKLLFWDKDKYSPVNNFDDIIYDADIYVSPNGNDANSGTIDAPVQTLQEAQERAREAVKKNRNVTVHISGTNYITEPLEFDYNDNPYSGKTVKYIGDETAEINGGVEVSGWEDYTHNGLKIKRAKLNVEDIRQFYVNGNRKQRARTELITPADYWEDENYVTGEVQFTLPSQGNCDANPEADGFKVRVGKVKDAVGAEGAEFVSDLLWTTQRVPIESIYYEYGTKYNSINCIIKMKQPYFHAVMTNGQRYTVPVCSNSRKDTFYIENVFAYLDEPGEFYFDKENQYIYYYPVSGESLDECYVGISEGYINVFGTSEYPVSNITIEGITFKYGTWLQPNEEGAALHQADCMIKQSNCNALDRQNGHLKAQIEVNYASNFNIVNNKFYNTGSTAIGCREGVSYSEISGNTFDDISGAAIMLGSWMQQYTENYGSITNNITVSDNMITNAAVEYCSSAALGGYYVQNCKFMHNHIENTAYTGITLGWGWGNYAGSDTYGNEISYNKIINVMTRNKDGAHIYTLGNMPGCVIKDNYLYKSSNTGNGGGGIYFDSGSADITAKRNVISDCKYWMFDYSEISHDNVITNNFYNGNLYVTNSYNTQFENNIDCSANGWTKTASAIIGNAGILK